MTLKKSLLNEIIKINQPIHKTNSVFKPAQTVPDRREADKENAQQSNPIDTNIRVKPSFRIKGPSKLLIHLRLISEGNGTVIRPR